MMNTHHDEYSLAIRARDGDQEALSALVEQTRMRLFALAYAKLRHYEDAQDVVVSALQQVCMQVNRLRQPERVHAWMDSILRNEIRQFVRRRGREVTAFDFDRAAQQDATSYGPLLLRIDIERALRKLPQDQRRALALFYFDDYSIQDIASRLGRPEGTIRRWLHQGRRRLALEMEGVITMPSKQIAALIHTDLAPDLVQKLTQTLQRAGYETKILPSRDLTTDLHRDGLLAAAQGCAVIVMDEWIGGRPALEFIMHLKGNSETGDIPICLLCSEPSDFTAGAYFSAGVERLIDRNSPEAITRLEMLPFSMIGKRVVVCEDEAITQMQISAGLARMGLSIVGTAADGQEAIETVRRERPDIVLMDICMPGMDGIEATRRIMTERPVCIIMLTAYTDKEEPSRAAGASGYIIKPLTHDLLRRKMQEGFEAFHRAHRP